MSNNIIKNEISIRIINLSLKEAGHPLTDEVGLLYVVGETESSGDWLE